MLWLCVVFVENCWVLLVFCCVGVRNVLLIVVDGCCVKCVGVCLYVLVVVFYCLIVV